MERDRYRADAKSIINQKVYPGPYNINVNGQVHIDTGSRDETCIDISADIWLIIFIHAGCMGKSANSMAHRVDGK